MTPEQHRAHSETERILRRYCDAAEAHLRALAARSQGDGKLCPCGIDVAGCLCSIQRARAG